MSYQVEYRSKAIVGLELLSAPIRERVLKRIVWLTENCDQVNHESLKYELADFFKLKIGDYRVLCDFDVQAKLITVYRVEHRSRVYKTKPR